MNKPTIPSGLLSLEDAVQTRKRFHEEGRTVVFTNGVFDILHRGHVEYLQQAKEMGDVLIVGLNTDASVRRLKGPTRPVVPQDDRAAVLSSLRCVDIVVLFEEDTPLNLITALLPDVLVKGADWPIEKVVGKDVVERAGGAVRTITFLENRSTTSIIDRILNQGKAQ